MAFDTYDTHSPLNPYNQLENEPLSELEALQEWNRELLKSRTKLLKDLQVLREIESNLTTFGFLTYEEQKQKSQILKL